MRSLRRLAIVVAVALLGPSAWVLGLMVREAVVTSRAYAQWRIEPLPLRTEVEWPRVRKARLLDRAAGVEYVATIERIKPDRESLFPLAPLEEYEYRLMLVRLDGQRQVETFTFDERARPRYRTMLAGLVTHVPIGFYSQVLQYWPTVWYPIVFPVVSFVVGMVLLGVAVWRRRSNLRLDPAGGTRSHSNNPVSGAVPPAGHPDR